MKSKTEKFLDRLAAILFLVLIAASVQAFASGDKTGMFATSFCMGMCMSDWLHEKLDEWEGE